MKIRMFLVVLTMAVCCLPAAMGQLIINEIDADQSGTDSNEFIELYDGGTGNTALDGYVVVLFNGSDDASYDAIDLDGYSTDANGYFVIGSATVPNVDLAYFTTNGLQNGADAVALYADDAASFPMDTPVTTVNLIDAVVYDTGDPDDTGLLVLLNSGEPQVDENMNGAGVTESIGRCPNGAGGARNTTTYLARTPTPGDANDCPSGPTPTPTAVPTAVVVTIADVQGMGASSPYAGSIVTVTGICYAVQDGRYNAFIADGAGAWNGIVLYMPGSGWTGLAVGDEIQVTGEVQEFNDLTEITNISAWSVLSSGNPVYPPTLLTTAAANDEQYESTYVRFENVTVTNEDLGFGEWEIDDGSGPFVVDDIFIYSYTPLLGDLFDWIQGPVYYSFGAYKLEPYSDSEMQLNSSGPTPTPGPTETPVPATPVTIYDIQFTTDPSGDSPYINQQVEFDGVITATEDGQSKLWVQDGTGPWNGVMIYESYPGHSGYSIGDAVSVNGLVEEYNNLTEISGATITVTGTGTLPNPVIVTTLGAADEQYEGVLIEVENVNVTTVGLPFWYMDDGSGELEAYTYFDAQTYIPSPGEALTFVRGVCDYYNGVFEILPRSNADIGYDQSIPATGPAGIAIMLVIIGAFLGLAAWHRR